MTQERMKTLPLAVSACIGALASTAALKAWRPAPSVGDGRSSPIGLDSITHGTRRATQVILVLLGTERLLQRQTNEVMSAFREFRAAVRKSAAANSMSLVTVGAAIDHAPDQGLRWLGKIGGFDEVSAGQSWTGSGAREFVWADSNPQASLPQVMVLIRNFRVTAERVETHNSSPILRLRGKEAILNAKSVYGRIDSLLRLAAPP